MKGNLNFEVFGLADEEVDEVVDRTASDLVGGMNDEPEKGGADRNELVRIEAVLAIIWKSKS